MVDSVLLGAPSPSFAAPSPTAITLLEAADDDVAADVIVLLVMLVVETTTEEVDEASSTVAVATGARGC